MRPRLPILVLALALAAAGCSKREHSNIFDPANPATHGSPIAFAAVADNGLVRLSWQPVEAEGLIGYELLRRVEGETEFTPIGSILQPRESHYSDFGAENGLAHHYRLYYVLEDGGRAGTPAEDVATPGTARVWVADLGGRLLRLAPDGRHVASIDDRFTSPGFVAVSPINGLVWLSDGQAGEIALVDAGFGRVSRFVAGIPGAIAIDPQRHTAWVCDGFQNVVHHLSEGAGPISPQLGPLEDPIACAVVPSDGSVWVCENRVDRVRRFAADGSIMAQRILTRPSRVAVDSLTLDAWVTSLEARSVVRLGPGGVPEDTVAMSGPVGVAVDARRGRIWVADAAGGAVVALERDGSTAFRIGGLPYVTEITVDLRTGDAWATLPSSGEVARIRADGSQVSRFRGLGEPYGISVVNAAG